MSMNFIGMYPKQHNDNNTRKKRYSPRDSFLDKQVFVLKLRVKYTYFRLRHGNYMHGASSAVAGNLRIFVTAPHKTCDFASKNLKFCTKQGYYAPRLSTKL